MRIGGVARRIAAAAGLALALGAAVQATARAEKPTLRVAVQATGTVSWELATMASHGFDAANGFQLQVHEMAGGPATTVAFEGGAADTMVTDWLWVARQRAAGRDYVFLPFSRAVGALMVPAASPAQGLADLKGARIGIAGGPIDKSWLILRAYAAKHDGLDLAGATTQVYGAPPLILHAAMSGDVDGAINFWNYTAKMQAAGMRPLITIADASRGLGLDPDMPLLGYVFKGEMLRAHPRLVAGFARASLQAKAVLAADDAAWEALRPQIHAGSEAEFAALKAGFRAGIPAPGPVDRAAAGRFLALMAELGGPELTGGLHGLPDGVFLDPPR